MSLDHVMTADTFIQEKGLFPPPLPHEWPRRSRGTDSFAIVDFVIATIATNGNLVILMQIAGPLCIMAGSDLCPAGAELSFHHM